MIWNVSESEVGSPSGRNFNLYNTDVSLPSVCSCFSTTKLLLEWSNMVYVIISYWDVFQFRIGFVYKVQLCYSYIHRLISNEYSHVIVLKRGGWGSTPPWIRLWLLGLTTLIKHEHCRHYVFIARVFKSKLTTYYNDQWHCDWKIHIMDNFRTMS